MYPFKLARGLPASPSRGFTVWLLEAAARIIPSELQAILKTGPLREATFSACRDPTAKSSSTLTQATLSQGQYTKTEPLNGRALAIREKVLGPDHPDVATCRRFTAGCLHPNALSGSLFFSFVKLEPFDRNKGATRGRFTPKDSPLASHPG